MPSKVPRGSGGYFVVSVRDVPTSRHLDRLLSQSWRLLALAPSEEPRKQFTLVYLRDQDTGCRHLVETYEDVPDAAHLAEKSGGGWLPVSLAPFVSRGERHVAAVYRRSMEADRQADSSTIPPFEPWVFVESVAREARQKQRVFKVEVCSSVPDAQELGAMLRQGWHMVAAAATDDKKLSLIYTRGAPGRDRYSVEAFSQTPNREQLEARLAKGWRLITLATHRGSLLGVFRCAE